MTAMSALFSECGGVLHRPPSVLAGVQCEGKAAGLSCLHREGFDVPAFVALSTRAFELYSGKDTATAFLTALWDDLILELGSRLAVRSSFGDEDSTVNSWAGVGETVLDVNCAQEFASAVQRVWRSAASVESRSYAERRDVAGPGAIAVVIQTYVKAVVSGVFFTADPITGDPSQLVIEAGAGSHTVKGECDERVSMDKITGEIRSHLVRKEILSSEHITRVHEVASSLDRKSIRSVDVEWIIPDDSNHRGLYILQARPITSINTIRRNAGARA